MKLTLCLLIFAAAVLGQDAPPLACNLKVFQAEERKQHIKLTHDIISAVVGTLELARGYAFQIDPERISLLELSEWAGRERKCCPFFDFQITLDGPAEGRLTLAITGREGVKQFIRSEFEGLLPARF